jgi:hypothetical protein
MREKNVISNKTFTSNFVIGELVYIYDDYIKKILKCRVSKINIEVTGSKNIEELLFHVQNITTRYTLALDNEPNIKMSSDEEYMFKNLTEITAFLKPLKKVNRKLDLYDGLHTVSISLD